MVKLNFKQFKIYTGVTRKSSLVIDASEQVADMVYAVGAGAFALSLSQRILHTEGEEEYNEREVDIIRAAIDQRGTAKLMDSFNEALEEQNNY